MNKTRSHRRIRALTEGAILVALAQILSFLKLYEFPQGGSITLEMLPIFLYCLRWGLGPGLTASAAFGLLQLLTANYAWTWQSMLGDYLLAFTLLGLCGAFRKLRGGVYLGIVTGSAARFLSHFVTGATVWRIYMPDEFFGMTMTNPWFYSLLYNGSFMALDTLLCLVLAALLVRNSATRKYILAEDI